MRCKLTNIYYENIYITILQHYPRPNSTKLTRLPCLHTYKAYIPTHLTHTCTAYT